MPIFARLAVDETSETMKKSGLDRTLGELRHRVADLRAGGSACQAGLWRVEQPAPPVRRRPGYRFPIYDRSQGIVNSVKEVQATLFVAFALVVLVIFFFLGRARHLDSGCSAAAVPPAHFRGHGHPGLQPGQLVPDGPDAGHRILGR
jgi:hypothetical protein